MAMGTCRQFPKRLYQRTVAVPAVHVIFVNIGDFPQPARQLCPVFKKRLFRYTIAGALAHHPALGQRALVAQKMLAHMALFHARMVPQLHQARRMSQLLFALSYCVQNFFL
jgi:hypothetical protein